MDHDRGAAEIWPLTPFLRVLLFGAVLVVVFSTSYSPHLEHRDPLHFDEWSDIGRARDLVDMGRLELLAPDTGYERLDNDISNRNREFGFFVLIGWIAVLGDLDLVAVYHPLAALWACFTATALAFLVRRISGSFWACLFAALFFATARSNPYLLGTAYFVPLTFSLPFLLIFLGASIRAREEKDLRWAGVCAGAAVILAIAYPLSLVVALLLHQMQWIVARERWREWRMELAVTAPMLGCVVVIVATVWQGGVIDTLAHVVELLTIPSRWHMDRFVTFPLTYFATGPLLALAVIGLVRGLPRSEHRWLVGWFLLPLISDWFYRNQGVSFLVPYQRMWHYWMLAVYCLAGFGLAEVMGLLSRRTPRGVVAVVGIAAAAMVFVFKNDSPKLLASDRMTHGVPAEMRRTLEWIEREYDPPAVVEVRSGSAFVVKPLTGLTATDDSFVDAMSGRRRVRADCDGPYDLVIGWTACPNFKRVFDSDQFPVYEKVHPESGQRDGNGHAPDGSGAEGAGEGE